MAWARRTIAPLLGGLVSAGLAYGVGANPAAPPASRWSSRRRARLSQHGYGVLFFIIVELEALSKFITTTSDTPIEFISSIIALHIIT